MIMSILPGLALAGLHRKMRFVLDNQNVRKKTFSHFQFLQVRYTVERTVKEVNRLRDMSPLWDMVQVC